MSFAPLLFQAPRRAYSESFLRALARAQDEHFAGRSEDDVPHAQDWESRVPPKAFFLVRGTHKYQDGRRSTTHCTTFQAKADALTFASRWRLNCPADTIDVLTGSVAWAPFEPTTATDRKALAKVRTIPSEAPVRPQEPRPAPRPGDGAG